MHLTFDLFLLPLFPPHSHVSSHSSSLFSLLLKRKLIFLWYNAFCYDANQMNRTRITRDNNKLHHNAHNWECLFNAIDIFVLFWRSIFTKFCLNNVRYACLAPFKMQLDSYFLPNRSFVTPVKRKKKSYLKPPSEWIWIKYHACYIGGKKSSGYCFRYVFFLHLWLTPWINTNSTTKFRYAHLKHEYPLKWFSFYWRETPSKISPDEKILDLPKFHVHRRNKPILISFALFSISINCLRKSSDRKIVESIPWISSENNLLLTQNHCFDLKRMFKWNNV